ncbi:AraC family transcriptional regulator [Chitinophaga sp. sic0106]|uniref:helix-turn-helix domain-containing protein n=1 Tax=Chitinophaga sp. sic0106 TaxID=2854785 RepID=UPI001C480379|nr:AraC family transcriptional regulator [Chitinophaga sp. sic0106]MBV7532098.1 AraC family transcriptional regulator [Chitinophaga sp. sic0106]
MADKSENKGKILYNCYFNRSTEGEQFIQEHVFTMQVSGTLTINDGKKTFVMKEGDFRLSRRNKLAKFVKDMGPAGDFRSISVYLDQELLRKISQEKGFTHIHPSPVTDAVIVLKDNPLYKSYMDSLLVYLQMPPQEQQAIMDLKVREAVLLLLQVNPEVKEMLFDFSEPGKIDLENFMAKNFRFNVSMGRFAYLTGRSLSTFKRDFEKVFHTTPSKWLLDKRLEEAHFQIANKGRTPSDVYLEVGFEDLSHFSYAFKNKYAVNPSALR